MNRTSSKYGLLEDLGQGSFATVCRACDSVLEREVALKVLHPWLLSDPAVVERFSARRTRWRNCAVCALSPYTTLV